MNRYWHVLQTYLWRPRFWWMAGFAVMVLAGWWYAADPRPDALRAHALLSANFSCVAGCFVALHVRRQFGTAAARLSPGYAAPHLIVAAAISLTLWVAIPGVMMRFGGWPPGSMALHALAGILIGAVACWPRALVLLAALPVLFTGRAAGHPHGMPLLVVLVDNVRPAVGTALIATAVASNLVAIVVLLLLPRRGITTNDEIALEPSAESLSDRSLGQWLLRWRDAAAQGLENQRWLASVQRWRVPVATTWLGLVVPLAVVWALTLLGAWFDSASDWATGSALITSAVLLIVPLGPWHVRRRALFVECMRPVIRTSFFRQILLALAADVALWALAGTIISVTVFSFVPPFSDVLARWQFVAAYAAILWSMAWVIFSLAAATIRMRFWMLIVAAAGLAWFIGAMASAIVGSQFIRHEFGLRTSGFEPTILFALASLVVGAVLTGLAYRRLVTTDLV
ncbi:MAG: hypothetical protein DWQ37_23535 [Planctomycetota bacterium]|nr:MAG: hypothetical protein DWQ37_23535 [Planctomycetota bacterium]